MAERIKDIKMYCELINELDDTMINANLEHLRRHIANLDILLYQLRELKNLINIYFFPI